MWNCDGQLWWREHGEVGHEELGGSLGLGEQQVERAAAVGSGSPQTWSPAAVGCEAFRDARAAAWSSLLVGPQVPALCSSQPLWEDVLSLGLLQMEKLRLGGINQFVRVTSGRSRNRTPTTSLELTPELTFWETGWIKETR